MGFVSISLSSWWRNSIYRFAEVSKEIWLEEGRMFKNNLFRFIRIIILELLRILCFLFSSNENSGLKSNMRKPPFIFIDISASSSEALSTDPFLSGINSLEFYLISFNTEVTLFNISSIVFFCRARMVAFPG